MLSDPETEPLVLVNRSMILMYSSILNHLYLMILMYFVNLICLLTHFESWLCYLKPDQSEVLADSLNDSDVLIAFDVLSLNDCDVLDDSDVLVDRLCDLDKLPDVLILNEPLSDVDVRNESDVLVDRLSDFSVLLEFEIESLNDVDLLAESDMLN